MICSLSQNSLGVRDHEILKASIYPPKGGFIGKYHGEVKMMEFERLEFELFTLLHTY